MTPPIAPHRPPARPPATVAAVEQAEARVKERDRMLLWRAGRLRTDARAKWQQQRVRALTLGGGLGVGMVVWFALSRRSQGGSRQRPKRWRAPPAWMRLLPLAVSLSMPAIQPALRRRLGHRASTWLMALMLRWRPRARLR